jgi:site-specific recombinase XerD
LVGLRPIDIEMDAHSGVWTYRPEVHKNAYREKERVVYFGPRAQEVLRPFLSDRPTHVYRKRSVNRVFHWVPRMAMMPL